jgi:hypothetical protein
VARAKRTDRAEARRKYRAYLQEQAEAGTPVESVEDEPVAGRWRFPGAPKAISIDDTLPASARSEASKAPTGRLSIMQAAKAAYRQPHYRDDLKNIGVLFRSSTIWVVLAVCLVSAAYVMARLSSLDNIAEDAKNDFVLALILQFILSGYPMLPPMLAGFLAPRSSWLAGAISSVMAILIYAGVLVFKLTQGGHTVAGDALAQELPLAMLQALPFGIGMAAAAAWYKRFLPLTSPPRPDKSKSKRPAPQRRRPATRG